MDNKKLNRLIAIITLIIALIGLGVSLVAINSTINIAGYDEINTAKWDVHFENLSKVKLTGTAYESSKPIIKNKSTSIDSFNIIFNDAKDTATYFFDVVNSGLLDAKVTTISILKPVCIGINDNSVNKSVDASIVCQSFEYSLTYADGKEIKLNDKLPSKSRKRLKLNMKYSGNIWPTNSVKIKDLSASIIYSQG